MLIPGDPRTSLTLCTLPQHHPESIRGIQTPELHRSSLSLKRRRDPRIDLAADVPLRCDPDRPAPSVSTPETVPHFFASCLRL